MKTVSNLHFLERAAAHLKRGNLQLINYASAGIVNLH
jgi:hypothetical protein